MNATWIRLVALVICVVLGSVGAARAQAIAYFVATNGSDTNPGTEAQPFRTIKKGVQKLVPGATLFIKSGTYVEALETNYVTIPSGTSWAAPVTIAAAPGAQVILQPPA